MHRASVALVALLYVGVIVGANALTSTFGLVAAGFGLLVTAGTYSAGLALGLRDVLHESIGTRGVLAVIAVGTLVTSLFSPSLAVASGAAFLLSELLDLLVYARLRVRGWRSAVVASNFVGSLADTLLFLALSPFPITASAVGGQVLVKALWVSGAFLLCAEVMRRALPGERIVSPSSRRDDQRRTRPDVHPG